MDFWQVTIHDGNGQVKGLILKLESLVDLDDPVDKDRSHLVADFFLSSEEAGLDWVRVLEEFRVAVDSVYIGTAVGIVKKVVFFYFLDCCLQLKLSK